MSLWVGVCTCRLGPKYPPQHPILKHLLTALKLSTALKCVIYSMTCRSSVVEVVSTFKIHKTVTLVKIVYGLNLKHQPLRTELKLLFMYIFSNYHYLHFAISLGTPTCAQFFCTPKMPVICRNIIPHCLIDLCGVNSSCVSSTHLPL
jgi:hypothetical protein